ncbi:helix-turn-helix domain-containing protein [Candidatus Bathyarchaeota archaeon]|nr:helix-turn-helix domain-containing protein [Candidatus Bathyarchaeota archaeon]MBT4320046.1 helix-turn-helix domain-containing protein [Candidatus Bathyarchaeota archaeon]MBT6605009.1 helix-turn-helix domain-containing protein [Candidatus Bathyarchaeota archaeon]MBT7914767.1 helix-turn-helix domain-containing protein [Candidatus Bathyarchaeota archaeon]
MSEKNDKMKKSTPTDFELVVEVLGNPVRRRLIEKLSEAPDYTLRLSNELNIHQQLAAKHMKVLRNAQLVDVVRQKSKKGADKNVFSLNKFYSLQIDFSPNLYNQRLISFNNPDLWTTADNYMDKLEDKVTDLGDEEPGIDKINPLGNIVQSIDDELESLEKRRARLLYIRNLAMNASVQALDDLDRKKRQVMHFILNQGSTTLGAISRHMQLREDVIRDLVSDLENEDIVRSSGNMVYLVEL